MNSAYACRQSAQGRNQRISGVDFLDGSFLVEVCQRFCSDAPVVVRPGTPEYYMAQALNLAKRGYGTTSPNPMVGAVLVKAGRVIGSGWHHQAGKPHAENEAIAAARRMGEDVRGATLYVTLEPCSTHGRTPPCTEAILRERIREVVVGETDPNPEHGGRAFARLKRAGLVVHRGVMAADCTRLNEGFNHWIVHRTPFVIVKAGMTLDGKIATSSGESKWITSPAARMEAMRMSRGVDAILVGINTVVADDPSLTYRAPTKREVRARDLRRIVLDPAARIPLNKKLISDEFASLTTVVVSENAPKKRIAELRTRVNVMVCPTQRALESEGNACAIREKSR